MMKKPSTYFMLICFTVSIGGLYWLFSSPKPRHYDAEIQSVKEYMQDISRVCQKYQEKHGSYPSNDEGLNALDTFAVRFGVSDTDFGEPGSWHFHLYNRHSGLYHAKHEIEEYIKEHGVYPKNAEEFNGILFLAYFTDGDVFDIGVSKENLVYVITDSGIISPWGIPFLYENRIGTDAVKWEESPVDSDTERVFSVKIDDDIYVYSIGSMKLYEEYVRQSVLTWIVRSLFVLLLLVFFVQFFRYYKFKKPDSMTESMGRVGLGVASLVSAFLFMWVSLSATCYIIVYFRKWRREEMKAEYTKLLEKYRKNGVIKESTYIKFVNDLDAPFGKVKKD